MFVVLKSSQVMLKLLIHGPLFKNCKSRKNQARSLSVLEMRKQVIRKQHQDSIANNLEKQISCEEEQPREQGSLILVLIYQYHRFPFPFAISECYIIAL